MGSVELTPETLDAAARMLATAGPVLMVNLLRYRPQAEYANGGALPPCSGKEAYFGRYVPAFAQVAERVAPNSGFAPVLLGSVHATLVAAPGESWDDIAIVKYPSFEALRSVVASPDYEAQAAPHRRAALADWRFVAATEIAVPG